MKSDADFRQKYLDTLARLESGEARWAKLENVLRLTVGRLCLAGRGRSALLDGELRTLGDLIRRQPEVDDLEARLEPLSRAIAALDQMPAQAPAEPSSTPVAAPPERRRLASPEVSPSRDAAPPAEGAQTEAARALSSAQAERAPAETDDSAAERDAQIQTAIVAMLERLALLPELRPALAELHDRPIAGLTPDELAEGLERVARLIGEQRSRLQREKLEIEALLRQIDARLEELTSYLAGEAAEQQTAQESTQQLNLLVMDEVHELNTDVQRALDLGELRARVRVRLEAINTHLEDFRAREEERLASQIDRTGKLRVRIAELERESRNLQRSLQEEQRLAMMDALTGIANRAAYDDRIAHEYLNWQQGGIPVSILAWDIDHFKAINDAYGHRAGDKVLRVIGQHLAQHVRGTDFVARYGGEEFVMILVGTAAEQALVAADKIRTHIAKIGFHFRNKPVTVTASCGISMFRPDDTPDSVFDRADRALYRAKEAGRNCCVIL
ncbi:MAG TPA: diguanylate cyclase [Steroidobacteraceae bacterium]|nr:diguanylate cyclase [Steroidobacteraceae bacterium]